MLLLGLMVGLGAGVVLGPRVKARLDERRYLRKGPSQTQLLSLVLNDSPTGIAVVDGDRAIVLHNRRADELGLVHEGELDDRGWAAARQVLTERRNVDFDLVGDDRKRGRSLSVRGQARLLDARVGRYAVLFADDDSEIVRMESARRDFVANVSHELKTPVGAMGLLAEALLTTGAGVLAGLVLGTLYGFAGYTSTLASSQLLPPQMPWAYLPVVVLGAAAFAVVASLAPGRRAGSVPPAEALRAL